MANVVDPGYGAWLETTSRLAGTTISGALATWGTKALDSQVVSALALQADAQAEATRQAQFLAGPLARDKLTIAGLRHDLLGKLIVATGDRAGYENSPTVFVIGVAESDTGQGRTTVLTVLKRL